MSSQETKQGTTQLATDDTTQDATQEGANDNATRDADQNPIQDAWHDTAEGRVHHQEIRPLVFYKRYSIRQPTKTSLKRIMMKTKGLFAINLKVEADKALLPEIEEDYARAQAKFGTLLEIHNVLQSRLVETGTVVAGVSVHTPVEGYKRGRKIAMSTERLNLQGPYYLSDYEQVRPEGLAGSSE
ncbi:uncharacterized protein L199_003516 [Kwoniella botswanensis]|uniref:uncharacterized protein n=1 Tax=Kwoniella botswanensis TaxID=1268659 RepID=UPI00315C9BFB